MFMPTVSKVKNSGFSLIELLVVTAIMLVVVGGSIAGFVTFRDRQQVTTGSKEIQQLLRSAQAKARVRETPTSCSFDGNRLQGYRVVFNSSTYVTLHPLCGADAAIANPTTLTQLDSISSVTLVGATMVTSLSSIDFYTLHRGVKIHIGGGIYTNSQQVKFTGNTYSYCFDVEDNGSIGDVVGC